MMILTVLRCKMYQDLEHQLPMAQPLWLTVGTGAPVHFQKVLGIQDSQYSTIRV